MRIVMITLIGLILSMTQALAQSGYRIKSGDTLTVEVLEDNSLNRSLLVLPDGSITFPFAGNISAGGRTVAQVQQAITSGISGNFAAPPTVFVTVTSLRPTVPTAAATGPVAPEQIEIFFVGEVNGTGARSVAPGTTFLQAMALSGGFTNFAADKRVQLRRTGPDGKPQVILVNYRAISRGALLARDIVLSDGDVILVPERRLFE